MLIVNKSKSDVYHVRSLCNLYVEFRIWLSALTCLLPYFYSCFCNSKTSLHISFISVITCEFFSIKIVMFRTNICDFITIKFHYTNLARIIKYGTYIHNFIFLPTNLP
jgi:hypothetical protein